jgi:hypothetical protein
MKTATASFTTPTTTTAPPRRALRSVGAVAAGVFSIFAVTTATDALLHVTGVFPPMAQIMSGRLFALAVAYRLIYGVFGSYVTARLAPHHPRRHAFVLAALGTVFSIAGAVAMGDRGPAWYSVAVIAMSFPCAWAGARLRERQLAE